jgi:1-acyl-sn-glycerol-3-phosphate acyltransferase
MNRYRMQAATGWWSPKLNATVVKLMHGFRRWKQTREVGLVEIQVLGAERVRQLIQDNHALLITPNHSTHADAYAIYAGADAIGVPFYMMAAWQVFADKSWLGQQVLRWHGCFSVDREGTDLRAFKQAVEVLEKRREPLVVFPEGEVYHCNARVRPFRDGAAAIALSAGKRGRRPIACVPCGIWYEYIDSPEAELLKLMDDLEREMFWRPRPDLPLHERIYRFAEVPLMIKELEFLGRAGSGPLPQRLDTLIDKVLSNVEVRYGITQHTGKAPERVKELRFRVIQELKREDLDDTARRRLQNDLDDVFLAVQLYSYPGDYVAEEPTIERMAETLDKFEEDVLNRYSATVRGTRRARIMFGEPIAVQRSTDRKMAVPQLTEALEHGVQQLIDQLRTGPTSG